MDYKDMFNALPKLVSIYGHKVAYQIETKGNEVIYQCFGKKHQNGEWYLIGLTRSEIAGFIVHRRSDVKTKIRTQYSDFTLVDLDVLNIKALDPQLMKLGEGYNCSWQSVYIEDTRCVGYVHNKLKTVAVLHDVDIASALLTSVSVEGAGFRAKGISDEYKFQLFERTCYGLLPKAVVNYEQAKQFAIKILEFHRRGGMGRIFIASECKPLDKIV